MQVIIAAWILDKQIPWITWRSGLIHPTHLNLHHETFISLGPGRRQSFSNNDKMKDATDKWLRKQLRNVSKVSIDALFQIERKETTMHVLYNEISYN